MTGQVLYRYEAKRYSVVIDADSDRYGVSDPELQLIQFAVTKVTKCGFWIDGWDGSRWVSNSSRKRFAYPTKELALESFKARRLALIRILAARMVRARQDLDLAARPEKAKEALPHCG